MAGMKVVPIKSLPDGSLDHADLKEKAEKHKDNLGALMVCLLLDCHIRSPRIQRCDRSTDNLSFYLWSVRRWC